MQLKITKIAVEMALRNQRSYLDGAASTLDTCCTSKREHKETANVTVITCIVTSVF